MKRTEQGALNRNFPFKSRCGVVKVKIRTLAPMHLRRKVNETGFRSISLDRNDLKHCSKESHPVHLHRYNQIDADRSRASSQESISCTSGAGCSSTTAVVLSPPIFDIKKTIRTRTRCEEEKK